MVKVYTFNPKRAPLEEFVKDGVDALNDGVEEAYNAHKRRRDAESDGEGEQSKRARSQSPSSGEDSGSDDEEAKDDYGEQAEEAPEGYESGDDRAAAAAAAPSPPSQPPADDDEALEIAELQVKLHEAREDFEKELRRIGLWELVQVEKVVNKGKKYLDNLVKQVSMALRSSGSTRAFLKGTKKAVDGVSAVLRIFHMETGITDEQWENDEELKHFLKVYKWENKFLRTMSSFWQFALCVVTTLSDNYSINEWKKNIMEARQQQLAPQVLNAKLTEQEAQEFDAILGQ